MELNNWEKEFKEQLNSREIKPSDRAWEKLDEMLSAAEKPKAKFPWMYVAASFVGFLLIGTAYLSQKGKTFKVEKNDVVIQNTINPKNNKKPLDSLDVQASQIGDKTVAVASEKGITIFEKNKLESEPITVKDSSNQNQEVVSVNNQIKENDVVVNSSEKMNSKSLNKNKYISAEKLLAEVGNANFESKATNKTNEKVRKHLTVNPNRLLSDAEAELNQSYKESALDMVNKNLKAIKTALVNRNYEE